MNETTALANSPIRNLLPLISKAMLEKSGFLTIAAINGVSRSFTKEETTVPKAAPTTMPTAMSTTLPRNKNCLKPCITPPSAPGLREKTRQLSNLQPAYDLTGEVGHFKVRQFVHPRQRVAERLVRNHHRALIRMGQFQDCQYRHPQQDREEQAHRQLRAEDIAAEEVAEADGDSAAEIDHHPDN